MGAEASIEGGSYEPVVEEAARYDKQFTSSDRKNNAHPSVVVELITAARNQVLQAEADGRKSATRGSVVCSANDPIIQFSCPVYYCREDENSAHIEIIRLGDLSRVSTVEYTTKDGSAKEGIKFAHQEGTLKFMPGEYSKEIEVGILDDDAFDVSLEFALEIWHAEGARLASFPCTCRVVIIDDDAFPTNRFKEELQSDRLDEIPVLPLMIEYWEMCFRDKRLRYLAMVYAMLDQLKNIHFFVVIYLQMYLVDVVLADPAGSSSTSRLLGEETIGHDERHAKVFSDDGEGMMTHSVGTGGLIFSRQVTSIIVGLLYIFPFLGLHVADITKQKLGIGGMSRMKLQANLLRKFFGYSESTRHGIAGAEVTMTIVREVTEVVEMGLMKVIQIQRILGKILLAMAFILWSNPVAAGPVVVLPVIMASFLWQRMGDTVKSNELVGQRENDIVQELAGTVSNFRLLFDFNLSPMVVERFGRLIQAFNQSCTESGIILMNNMYLPEWLNVILTGGYLVLGVYLLDTCGGSLSLGTFLATINIFKEIGGDLKAVYCDASEILLTSGPLRQVCHFMNLPTDSEHRLVIAESRKSQCRISLNVARQTPVLGLGHHKGCSIPVDSLAIEMTSLTFTYGPKFDTVLQSVNASFQQGHLIAVLGPPHQGKSTLLRLIGDVLQAETDQGTLFIPPHLHVLHVSPDTFVVGKSSLLSNIVFNSTPQQYGSLDRIKLICNNLGFDEATVDLLDLAEDDPSFEHALEHLSHSDVARLNLARAFAKNPEVMVIHKPLLHFNDDESQLILALFREHVDKRGVDIAEPAEWRRPRTVIFTASHTHGLSVVDDVYEVKDKSVRRTTKAPAASAKRRITENLQAGFSSLVRGNTILDGERGVEQPAEQVATTALVSASFCSPGLALCHEVSLANCMAVQDGPMLKGKGLIRVSVDTPEAGAASAGGEHTGGPDSSSRDSP